MKFNNYSIFIFLFFHRTLGDNSLQCDEWDAFKDEKCFKVLVSKEFQTYDDAKNICYQMEGSGLVSIRSQEEHDFLIDLLHNVHKVVNDIWIGAQYKEKLFKWTDNTTANFTNWSSNDPKNDTSSECVQISMEASFLGKWFTEPCNKKNLVVCQKSQNWLFSYLQSMVIELRENFDKNNQEIKNLKSELEMTKSQLQLEIKKQMTEATPSGTIAYFANTTAPIGWLKANGMSVSRITYSNLFATIGTHFGSGDGSTTFTLPDLRGEFIRGWSDGRDVDKDRSLGSFQWGSNVVMAGFINSQGNHPMANAYANQWHFAGATYDNGYESDISTGVTRNGITLGTVNTDYNTATNNGNITSWNMYKGSRPRNIALLACIKY